MTYIIPPEARLITHQDKLYFLHSTCTEVRVELTAIEAYCRMTSTPSRPLRWAFTLRDKISAIFGVEKIYGFRHKNSNINPKPGDKLDFFTVEGVTDNQLVLTSRDRHLSVMVSLDLPERKNQSDFGKTTLFVTASVEVHNFFGKVYMLPVAVAHGIIVKSVLKKLSNCK